MMMMIFFVYDVFVAVVVVVDDNVVIRLPQFQRPLDGVVAGKYRYDWINPFWPVF